ncbi:MAG: LPS assembly protein LptD, partial [Pseudomonadota bacterium]
MTFASLTSSARRLLLALMLGCSAFAMAAHAQDAPPQIDAAPDRTDRVLFEADSLGRESEDGPIIAEGDVTAFFGDETLSADRVSYDPDTEVVTAEGDVALTTMQGNVFYADRIELSGDLRDGIATSFRALLDDDARLAAQYAVRRRGAVNQLRRAVYSACDVCEEGGRPKTPTWRLRAVRVTQNEERKTITYRHMFFDLKGVPVLYAPYFQQPDPSVERQSGFLTPNAGTSTEIGAFFELPYYFALSSSYDLTLAPLYTSDDGILWKGEWRQRFGSGDYIFQGGVIQAEEPQDAVADPDAPSPDEVARWHIFGEGDFDITEKWAAGFELARTSDDTYIRRYDIEPQGALRSEDTRFDSTRLTTNVDARRLTENSRLDIDTFFFQGLRPTDDQGLTPYVLPLVSYTHDIKPPIIGGRGVLRGNLLSLQRTEGVDTRRISIAGDWRRSRTSRNGQLLTAFAELRAAAVTAEGVAKLMAEAQDG